MGGVTRGTAPGDTIRGSDTRMKLIILEAENEIYFFVAELTKTLEGGRRRG